MQINKKLYTGLIVTLLALSTIAIAIPSAFATVATIRVLDAFGAEILAGSSGQFVDIDGTGAAGFALVEIFWDTPATKLGEVYANSAGAFLLEGVFLPEDVAGAHQILADDGTTPIYYEAFTIAPSMSVSTSKALPGDSIAVSGKGFGDELYFGIYLGDLTPVTGETVSTSTLDFANSPVVRGTVNLLVDVTIDGTVGAEDINPDVVELNIPVTDDGAGLIYGEVTDVVVLGATASGLVDVEITGTINYATGVITIEATGEESSTSTDPVTNIDVTIDDIEAAYRYAVYDVTPSGNPTTTELGSISEDIIIPNVPVASYGDYLITVIDTNGNEASPVFPFPSDISINYYIIATPASGPAGITVTLSGRIPANTAYEIRLDSTTIATGTSAADTTFTASTEMSSFLSEGSHSFYVVWDVTESRTALFELKPAPQVTYNPVSAMAGATVTISTVTSFPFSADANITLYLGDTVVNSTAMDDRFGKTVAAGPNAGSFTDLEFTVPSITPGVYVLKVVDEFGASTGNVYTFTVAATPETDIGLIGTAYTAGDALSFDIGTTDTITAMTVTVADPTGMTWWTVVDEWIVDFITVPGGEKVVPYQDQLFSGSHAVLPENAPVGSWNWTIIYTANTAGSNIKATGLFTVSAKATLNSVTADIADLVGEISDITDDVATIKTDVSNVEDLLEALDIPDFSDLTDGIASLEVSVDALEATVTGIEDGIATVDTAVGELEGTITSIEGDVATIQTDVGTLQADISDVKANVDNTPAWIAVVLALVAAVAAIFAVITIRQKIAG